jgi:hypothetical protein
MNANIHTAMNAKTRAVIGVKKKARVALFVTNL